MNNQERHREDILRQYIDPESIEKAPEEFTSKVMSRIQFQKQLPIVEHSFWRRNLVPLISSSVVILLIAVAFLLPRSESDSMSLPVLKLLNNIQSSLPEINFSYIFQPALPSILIYVITGIFVLTLFDRALYRIFHRAK
jgi:hypothetical protein